MVYYEYWDKHAREWYLGKTVFWKYLYMKFIVWFYGKDNFSVTDIKRIPKSEIKFD